METLAKPTTTNSTRARVSVANALGRSRVVLIGAFKSRVSFEVNKDSSEFSWSGMMWTKHQNWRSNYCGFQMWGFQ